MNCFHSSLNSVIFYKAFISRSTCMFLVIMGHINLFKLLRTEFRILKSIFSLKFKKTCSLIWLCFPIVISFLNPICSRLL